jgi:16S rRNA (adenine1518-N6/adenine1519-N6)-dimethyltransferase
MLSLYQETRNALHELAGKPRKRLGQHFLVQRRVHEVIVSLLELGREDEVLEVGAGLGFLTRRLVEIARRVWAIEVDPLMIEWLQNSSCGASPNLELIHGDILETEFAAILPHRKVKLAGNLPYNISTPVLFRVIEERARFSVMVLMLQREVALRIAAGPGTKAYGTLSVWWQVHGEVVEKVPVSAEAFYPRPKVRSMILKMRFYPEPLASVPELSCLKKIVRAAFHQRRKTLANALDDLFAGRKKEVEKFLRAQDVDPRRRGETLAVEEFLRLARALSREGLGNSGS